MWAPAPTELPADSDASPTRTTGGAVEARRQLAAVVGAIVATFMVVSLLALPNMKGARTSGVSSVPHRELQNPDGPDRPLCAESPERLRCPALDMFDDPSVHQKATDSLIWSGHAFLGVEARGDIKRVVAESFGGIRARLWERAPEMAQHVKNLQLTASESTAGLSAMQLIVDERVQSIGREVAAAMLSSLPEDEDDETSGGSLTIPQRDAVLAGLDERLMPILDKIRKTADATVPPPLRTLWGEGRQALLPSLSLSSWEMTLEPSVVSTFRASSDQVMMVRRLQRNSTLSAPPRVLLTRTSDTGRKEAVLVLNSTLSAPPRELLTRMTDAGRQEAILGLTLMLGRTLLNAMQMYMRLTANNSMAPLNNTEDVTGEIPNVFCEVGSGTSHNAYHMEPHQTALCSLKFGILGSDALRAAFMGDQMSS